MRDTDLLKAIMSRDKCSREEAEEMCFDMAREFLDMQSMDPEEILFEEGFEPDYVFDLMEYTECLNRERRKALA